MSDRYLTLEEALEATRPEWIAYQNATTPWPTAIEGRREAVQEYIRITEKRMSLLDPADPDRNVLGMGLVLDREFLERTEP